MNVAKDWRTFKAVFLRNLKFYTSYRTWIIATILWPLPLLALNIYQYMAFGTPAEVSKTLEPYGGVGMIVVGTIVYLLYNRLLWGTGVSIQSERWMGTIEVLFLTPTNKMVILLASGLSSLIEASWWIFSVFFLGWIIFGVQPQITSWSAVLTCLISTMAALVSIGVFFAGFFVLTRAADQLASGLQAPIRFFSGVAFPVSALPQMLQYISYLIPVTYGILALRKCILLGGDLTGVWVDIAPLWLMSAIFLVLGQITLKIVERQAKKKGTLYLF
ncbi:MAG: ABC transporter permease [Candidatus Bathyarchaeia archaeon]